jgi:hypothetical protein
MRKTNTTGNNISAGRLPQRLLPQGADPWKDPNFVKAYDQVAQVVNAIPYNPEVEKALRNVKPVALATAAVLQAVKEHEPSKEALRLLQNYEDSIRKQTENYLKNNLRFSLGQQETNFSEIAQQLSPNLPLGIPSPPQIGTTSAAWSSFYRDLLGLLDQVSRNPQDQDLLAQLAAGALVLTEGVHTLGDQQIRSPFSKIHIHPTTDITGSPSFLPSAKTLSETASLVETHGTAAVQEAINRAREATVTQVETVTRALSNMLRRDPQNPQKLDNIARAIIGHLAQIQQQYNIEVPGIDTQSAPTTETRAKAIRPIEELVRAFSSIKGIEQSRQRRMSNQSRTTTKPPELGPNAEEEALHSEYSMYAVGGTKPPTRYEQHSRQQASQKAPQLQKEFFEEQMNQYYMGVMKMIATIAGIAARKWASINLTREFARLRSEQATPKQNQGQVTEIEVPVTTGFGSTSVKVTSHEFAGDQEQETQTAKGYIPIGLPLGRMRAQPQLPSTFEEGQVKPAATITVGAKILKISEGSALDSTGPTIASVNPQQAVDHAVPISKEANQRLLVPIIEVVRTENNTLQVRARLQEITAPTISDQQIETIKNEITSLVDKIINDYRNQGSIPEDFIQIFEMAKALQNSPNAQFHSALLRIDEEMLADGRIIRLPVLNITFYLPENEVKILQEAARIKEQSSRLRAAGISTGETDTETDEDAATRQAPNTRRSQPRMQSVGTYKRSQVLQPTFEETEPEGTNRRRTRRQTASDRLVAVSFELSVGNYGELLAENLHPIEQIILDIYNQFTQQIESGAFITSQQDSTEFERNVAPGESLTEAIKKATQFLDFQIARRILTTMQNSRIPQLYTQRINAEYAAFLPQARQFPEEFERITQQSALPIEQEGPITFMARPIVKDDRLELLVLGYARTTPYLIKIQGTANRADLISDIADAYMGISQQSFEGRKQYSGGIFARYNLALADLDGQIEARLVEPPIQKGFAPDATLASGAVGLPSGIVTIIGTAGAETARMNTAVAQTEGSEANQPKIPATVMQKDEGDERPNSTAADIGTLSALLGQTIVAMLGGNEAAPKDSGATENAVDASTEPQVSEPPAEETAEQPANKPAPTPANETEPAGTPPAEKKDMRLFNKVFGSIKNPTSESEQQKEWIDIYRDLTSKARITIKEISKGTRGISKQLLMLIGGARRAEHRPALDDIVNKLQNKQIYASEVVSSRVPDLIGNTPDTVRVYRTTPVGQLQARPQSTQSAIDPNQPFVSFHGRKDASTAEMIQSFEVGQKIARAGGVLVVGGAVGADFAAALGALSEGGKVIIIHFSDFNTEQYGYPAFTRNALTNVYNNTRQYQEDNFMRNIATRFLNHSENTLSRTEILTRLVNKLATVMTLIAIAPNHPIIQKLMEEINMQLPPTAAVAFFTLRVVSEEQGRTAAESATIRDELMAAISDLTIEGPNRGSGSGTDKAVTFARTVARQAPDEKAVMTMQEILASDVETIRTKITELNEARKRNIEAYKQGTQR